MLRVLVKLQSKESLIVNLAYWIILLICKTLRVEKYEDESVFRIYDKGENFIYALWHRRLFYLSFYHSRRFPGKETYALVSQSRDGTRIGKITEKIGAHYIQGSTSKGGAKDFREMVKIIKNGYTAAITPDGPRGPRGLVQQGVISLARLTGRPVIPLAYKPKRYIKLRSWDEFIIPMPFSKVSIHTGKPIIIPKRDDNDDAYYQGLIKEGLDELEHLET